MSEDNVIIIPMMFDRKTFELLNDAAIKKGKTAAMLVTEALREKIKKIEEETRRPK
jgi:hypothetical protein